MGGLKTSRRRAISFPDTLPKLNNRKGLTRYDPGKQLRNPEKIAHALVECILDADEKSFNDILSAHVEACNKVHLAKKAKVGRKTLYRIIDKTANPRLKTIMRIVNALK